MSECEALLGAILIVVSLHWICSVIRREVEDMRHDRD